MGLKCTILAGSEATANASAYLLLIETCKSSDQRSRLRTFFSGEGGLSGQRATGSKAGAKEVVVGACQHISMNSTPSSTKVQRQIYIIILTNPISTGRSSMFQVVLPYADQQHYKHPTAIHNPHTVVLTKSLTWY